MTGQKLNKQKTYKKLKIKSNKINGEKSAKLKTANKMSNNLFITVSL